MPISTKTWQISQAPERLTFGTGREEQPSIAATGRLVFVGLNGNVDIWSLPIDPNEPRPSGELMQLTRDASSDLWASTSVDGKQLVYISNRGGKWDIWLRNNETGRENPLNTGADADSRPVIAASRIAYLRREGQKLSTYVLDLTAGPARVPEKLCDDCGLLAGCGKTPETSYVENGLNV